MDIRSLICGVLAWSALVCATVLAGLERDAVTVAALLGAAGTFGGYVVGLNSSPYDE